MPTASPTSSTTSTHHNQVGAPSDSDEVGWTDAEAVGDGASVGVVSVGGVVSSADDSVRVGSDAVGGGAATTSDDRVCSGAVSVGEELSARSGARVDCELDDVCSRSGDRVGSEVDDVFSLSGDREDVCGR